MQTARFPRVRLGHFPTPLDYLPRLTEALDGPRIFMKRDDCSGLGLGGSKVRKLEFEFGKAATEGCDTVLIHGFLQSNHARLVSAAAARTGLKCIVLLEQRVFGTSEEHRKSGNILLDHVYGADVRLLPLGSDLNAEIDVVAEDVRRGGGRPYVIRGGRPGADGALGYIGGALEVLAQAADLGVALDCVIHGSDSGGAQSGFAVGFQGLNAGLRHIGVSAGRPRDELEARVYELACAAARHAGLTCDIDRNAIAVTDQFVGAGYGSLNDQAREAVRLTARLEGILLDPVYTAKAMAALIAMVRARDFDRSQSVLFIHTGGVPAMFAYADELAALTRRIAGGCR